MASNLTPPRGMRDFLPAEKALRDGVLAAIRDSFSSFGYREIETPVAEDLARLTSGQGGDNEKLIYRILRRGLDAADTVVVGDAADLGLRFDLTLPLARFYATHRAELPAVFRAIQIAPVWRAERPQKGRYRQFTQCDIDVLGEASDVAEVELITATLATLDRVGIPGASVRINDRRVLVGMLDACGFAPAERPRVLITVDKLDKIGVAGVADELRADGGAPAAVALLVGLLEKLGATAATAATGDPVGAGQGGEATPVAGTAPAAGESRFDAVRFDAGRFDAVRFDAVRFDAVRFDAVLALLPGSVAVPAAGLARIRDAVAAASPGARLVADPTLVRGMGYYTGPIFELSHPAFSGSVAGGGRYDGMIGKLSGVDVPGCGFSIGFERIVGLVDPARFGPGRRQIALLHDAVPAGILVAWQRRLIDEGATVRLVPKARNLGRLLDTLATEGFDAYASLDSRTPAPGGSPGLDVRPLRPAPPSSTPPSSIPPTATPPSSTPPTAGSPTGPART